MAYTKYEWVDGELITAEKLNTGQDLLINSVDEKVSDYLKTINFSGFRVTDIGIEKTIDGGQNWYPLMSILK